MPENITIAEDVWNRYVWLRDNGHIDYVKKNLRCEQFFSGRQWTEEDLKKLRDTGRPALTINKILSTITTVLGEQIYNRTEIAFRPKNEKATTEVADALTRVFRHISETNNLPWIRSDVFSDGVISSRGFYDVRLDTSDSLKGEVRITHLNPRNVLIDADANEYDPDSWADVIVSRWMSPDQIALLYNQRDADILQSRTEPYMPYAYDILDDDPGQFGDNHNNARFGHEDYSARPHTRHVRVIERQWRKIDSVKHFADVKTGDLRPIPASWDDKKIKEYLDQNPNIGVVHKKIQRIRWTVVADNIVLHDDWSPYKHFTVVPYFPIFRRGQTLGMVENLIGPQELLNKSSSQELHVINTTANSGWKVKQNSLVNMSLDELEQRGAETGLVVELKDMDGLEKILPNQIPSGLDRVSFKAETHIDTISGVSRFMKGQAREDVSARAIEANNQQGASGLIPLLDNLVRTDTILARNILDIVQEFYTEERMIQIASETQPNQVDTMLVNEVTPEGEILRDLTLGEYSVVVTSEPERQTQQQSQFEQLVMLRNELGINVPPSFLVQASKARNKAELIKAIEGDPESPEVQQQKEIEQRTTAAQVQQLEASAMRDMADAELKRAKAQKEIAELQNTASGAENDQKMLEMDAQLRMAREKMETEMEIMRERMIREMEIMRERMQREMDIRRQQEAAKAQEEEINALLDTPDEDIENA